MLDIIDKIANPNPLRLSNAIQFAQKEVMASRDVLERLRARERDLLADDRRELADPAKRFVPESELGIAAADIEHAKRRYAAARSALAEARATFEPKWMERLGPIGAEMKRRLMDVADDLETAIQPAREAEAFAVAHGLPVTLSVAVAPEAARLLATLRRLAE